MILKEINSGLIWKRRVMLFLTVFFVFYPSADLTVLQVYCSNKTLNIPSYFQKVQAENWKVNNSIGSPDTSISTSKFQEQKEPKTPVSPKECFCCCSYTILNFNSGKSIVKEFVQVKQTESNFSNIRPQSDSHLPQLYQPPESAKLFFQ